MIRKTKSGKYVVKSEKSGKILSKPSSKKDAVKRLQQIEYFKHNPKTGKK